MKAGRQRFSTESGEEIPGSQPGNLDVKVTKANRQGLIVDGKEIQDREFGLGIQKEKGTVDERK